MTRATAVLKAFAAGLLGMALIAGAAQAQSQQQPQPMFGPRVAKPGQPTPPEIIGSFGAWKVTCENVIAPSEGGEANAEPKTVRSCGVVQGVKSADRKGVGLSLILVKAKQDGNDVVMVRVMAPIGVFLPMGVALEIDGAAISRVPFTRCAPQTCMAMGSASPETLAKFKKGKEATFIIYDGPAAGIPLKFKLEGFSDAMAALDKETAKK